MKNTREKQIHDIMDEAYEDVNKLYIKYGEKFKKIEEDPYMVIIGVIKMMRSVFEVVEIEGRQELAKHAGGLDIYGIAMGIAKEAAATDGMTPQ